MQRRAVFSSNSLNWAYLDLRKAEALENMAKIIRFLWLNIFLFLFLHIVVSSIQRSVSLPLVRFFSPHHRSLADTSCVTGLPARSKHRSCRIFLPSPTQKTQIDATALPLSGVSLPSPSDSFGRIPPLAKSGSERREGWLFSVKSQTIATHTKTKG